MKVHTLALLVILPFYSLFTNAAPVSFSLLDDYVSPMGVNDSQLSSATWTYRDSTGALLTPGTVPIVTSGLLWSTNSSIPIIGPPITDVNTSEIRTPSFDGLFLHPGFTEDVVARFQAPEELFITQLDILVEHVRTALSDGVLFSLVGPNGSILTPTTISPTATGVFSQFSLFSINTPLHLLAGDNLDFIVNRNGNAFSDWTNVSISINGNTESPSAVPVPAAAWLFGSGLIALIGVARRKA